MSKTKTSEAARWICVPEVTETVDGVMHESHETAEAAAKVAAAQNGGRVFVCRIESVAQTSVNVGAYTPPPKPRKPRADKGKPRAPKPRAHAPDSFAEAKAEAARRDLVNAADKATP